MIREYSPSKPDSGEPCVIQSISLEGGVIRVYAKSEEDIFTVTLSAEGGHTPQILSSLMKRSQMINRDLSFQIPSRSTPVSSALVCRSHARLIRIDSKMIASISKGPSPFLPALPEPVSSPSIAIFTSPKPAEPASASANSNDLPSSLPELSVLVDLADPSALISAQQEALKHVAQDT